MKKIVSIILVLVTVLSMGTMAFADGATKLTTTVPAAKYTLNIPADQVVTFGATTVTVGKVTVTNSENFAEGKNVAVTITYDGAFSSEEASTTIPYEVYAFAEISTSGGSYGSGGESTHTIEKPSGSVLTFKGLPGGKCNEYFNFERSGWGTHYDTLVLKMRMDSSDWGKALGGEYSTTITFTSKVVQAG